MAHYQRLLLVSVLVPLLAAPARAVSPAEARRAFAAAKGAILTPESWDNGRVRTPSRSPEARGYETTMKWVGPNRYGTTGLLSDFSPPAQQTISERLQAIAASGKGGSQTAGELINLINEGRPDLVYVEFIIAHNPKNNDLYTMSVSRMRDLSKAAGTAARAADPMDGPALGFSAPAPVAAAAPAVPKAYQSETRSAPPPPPRWETVSRDEAPMAKLPADAPVGPSYARLAEIAPDFHSVPEPLAIGREAMNTPNLNAEQRIALRDFATGPLKTFVKAVSGSGDLKEATEKIAAAAESSVLFINPAALGTSLRRLTEILSGEPSPTPAEPKQEQIAQQISAANRQFAMAGIYLNIVALENVPARAEAYVLKGKKAADVYGVKESTLELKHISGPAGWYGFYVPRLDVPADMQAAAFAFGESIGKAIEDVQSQGQIMSRPNGLPATVQLAWSVETLVRKSFRGKAPDARWAGDAWVEGVLLHQAFHSFFRKNGGTERAARASNAEMAKAVEEQGAYLYSLGRMEPRLVGIALCIAADRAIKEPTNADHRGARLAFQSLQNESGIQMLDPKGRLRLEGVRDLVALDPERIQQIAAAALAREIIRVYLPGTY